MLHFKQKYFYNPGIKPIKYFGKVFVILSTLKAKQWKRNIFSQQSGMLVIYLYFYTDYIEKYLKYLKYLHQRDINHSKWMLYLIALD